MRKTYSCPALEIVSIQAATMLAESLPIIKGTTVPGPTAQTKKNEWDIFGDDEVVEE
jgi:hypothetical protein